MSPHLCIKQPLEQVPNVGVGTPPQGKAEGRKMGQGRGPNTLLLHKLMYFCVFFAYFFLLIEKRNNLRGKNHSLVELLRNH